LSLGPKEDAKEKRPNTLAQINPHCSMVRSYEDRRHRKIHSEIPRIENRDYPIARRKMKGGKSTRKGVGKIGKKTVKGHLTGEISPLDEVPFPGFRTERKAKGQREKENKKKRPEPIPAKRAMGSTEKGSLRPI